MRTTSCDKTTRGERAPVLEELEEELKKAFESSTIDLFCGLAKEENNPPETLDSFPSVMYVVRAIPTNSLHWRLGTYV